MSVEERNVQHEIERLKAEIADLKREERAFNELRQTLGGLHQKLERLREDRRTSESGLQEKLEAVKAKARDADCEKDRLEKQLGTQQGALRNARVSLEELNEAREARAAEVGSLSRLLAESEELLRTRQVELRRAEKEAEKGEGELRETRAAASRADEELKHATRTKKSLEDERDELQTAEARLAAEIALLEAEVLRVEKVEEELLQRLRGEEAEAERVNRFLGELAREAMETRERNADLGVQREELVFKARQEGQRVARLDASCKQFQNSLNLAEEQVRSLGDKSEALAARISQKTAENAFSQTMLDEDKRELEKTVILAEQENEKLLELKNLHSEIIDKIQAQSKNCRTAELRQELAKILD